MKNILKSWFPTDGKIISNLIRVWATFALAIAMILFALAAAFFFLSLFLTPILDLDFEDLILPAIIGSGGGFALVYVAYFHRLIAYSLAAWTEASSIYIEKNATEKQSKMQINVDNERIKKLENLRSQGLITEEEYQQAISKEK